VALFTKRAHSAVVNAAASVNQSLPEPAVEVLSVQSFGALGTAADTLTAVPVVSGAPAAGQAQFTGTPSAPSSALVLGTAAAAGQALVVRYVRRGDLPASQ
jgi:hypothetical protein